MMAFFIPMNICPFVISCSTQKIQGTDECKIYCVLNCLGSPNCEDEKLSVELLNCLSSPSSYYVKHVLLVITCGITLGTLLLLMRSLTCDFLWDYTGYVVVVDDDGSYNKTLTCGITRDKLKSRSSGILSYKEEATRRQLLAVGFASPLVLLLTYSCSLTVLQAWAEDQEIQDKDESVVGAIKSLFDPNETTKSGKVLPKAYVQSAREVVKTLRESLKEDPNDMSKFRRTADAAKDSIREYLGGWRGQKSVVHEESYVMLEKAIRSLASFYSKAGPSAALPEEIKLEILDDLNKAEEGL